MRGRGPRGAGVHSLCFSPQYGKKKLKYLPYNHQHEYFFLSECRGTPQPRPPSHPSVAIHPRSHLTPFQTQKVTRRQKHPWRRC